MDSEDLDPMSAYVAQAWSMEGQLPLLIGIALLLGMGKGGVPGFATVATAATVATSPTNIPGGLGLAVALQVPILTMIDISAAWIHAKDLDFDSIKVLLPVSFVGMAIGQWLDSFLSDSNARFLIGLLLLMILFVQLAKDSLMAVFQKNAKGNRKNQHLEPENEEVEPLVMLEKGESEECACLNRRGLNRRKTTSGSITSTSSSLDQDVAMDDDSMGKRRANNKRAVLPPRTKYLWAAVVGLVGGAATMLTNAMGPILNVYLLSVIQLSPTAYIGTRAMFFCFLNCGKLPMRFFAGTLGWSMIPLAGLLGMVSVLGVIAAKPIMLSMSEANFVRLELAVVAFSGVRLCWMGWFGN